MNLQKIQEVLDATRRKAQEETEQWRKRKNRSVEELFREELRPLLRPATVRDYLPWLAGYIEKGGKPTHVYDYPFPMGGWYVAMDNISSLPLYGAKSINIIVPARFSVASEDWGHCNIFFMDNFMVHGIVPIFKDVSFKDVTLYNH